MSHFRRSRVLGLLLGALLIPPASGQELRKIKVGRMEAPAVSRDLGFKSVALDGESALFELTGAQVEELGAYLHRTRGRCGGFKDVTQGDFKGAPLALAPTQYPSPKQTAELEDLLDTVSADRIRQTVETLSAYPTRRYSTKTGQEAALWVRDQVQAMAKGRTDVATELVDHSGERNGWIMPSVIARIEGTVDPKESVVLGGHLDSINWTIISKKAPGADDDASGVATALETFRALLASGKRPAKTVEFMAYSAEEVGLWGSQSIARRYRSEGRKVRAVLQLDMVMYPSPDEAIYLVTDYVDSSLTTWLGTLGREVLGLNVRETTCGYGCSDHASWSDAGYPSVFPFEAAFDESNPKIHTAGDTIENAPYADHALKFAKLGLAMIWNLAFWPDRGAS